MTNPTDPRLQEFINELSGFAATAEDTLKKIEQDGMTNRPLFHVFSEKMFDIRGTAQQLELPRIAEIAGLGEEIAIKGETAERSSQIRKCIGSLWDALTTVKYLLAHPHSDTTEEQEILKNRLQATLRAFGGARETMTDLEITGLLETLSKDKK